MICQLQAGALSSDVGRKDNFNVGKKTSWIIIVMKLGRVVFFTPSVSMYPILGPRCP